MHGTDIVKGVQVEVNVLINGKMFRGKVDAVSNEVPMTIRDVAHKVNSMVNDFATEHKFSDWFLYMMDREDLFGKATELKNYRGLI